MSPDSPSLGTRPRPKALQAVILGLASFARAIRACQGNSVRVRAVVVGLVFVVLLCWAVPWVDIYFEASELAGSHFPLGPFLILLFLSAVVNSVLLWLFPRLAFTQAEQVTVYCMVLAAAGIPTYGLVAYLFPAVTAPFYYTTPSNEWAQVVGARIPESLRPTNLEAIRMFFEGAPDKALTMDLLAEWIGPLIHWSVFVLAIFGLMFCLTAIIQRQWVEKERLTFPLVELPLVLVKTESSDRRSFFGNPVVWVGVAVPFLIHALNSLQIYYPFVPGVELKRSLSFSGAAWPFGDRMFIYFSVTGFGYLLTSDVSFSVWFFFWVHKFQHYIASQYGVWDPYIRVREAQYIGAFIVFVSFILWREREHLRVVLRKAFLGDATVDDSSEPLGYRAAAIGAILCLAVLCAWCTVHGVSLVVFLVTFAAFIFVCFGLTRIVMETGIFSAKVTQMQPLKLMVPAVGTAAIGAGNLTMVSLIQYIFMYDLKTFLMPALMHGQRLAGRTRTNNRRLYLAVALAVLVAIVVSYWATLTLAYRHGGQTLSRWFYQSGPQGGVCIPVSSWLKHPEETDVGKLVSCGAGATFTGLLIFLRQHFIWWPLHPIGYILAFSFETTRVWFSFLLGWIVKVGILRYGGGRLYRDVRYLFLGFILGEFSAAGFWIVADLIIGKRGHVVFP